MNSKLKTLKEAKRITLDMWKYVLKRAETEEPENKRSKMYHVTEMKGDFLEKAGLDFTKNCALCQWQKQKLGLEFFAITPTNCKGCPINKCGDNGFDDMMTLPQIRLFYKYLKETLK